jgi:hypothetical protein
MGKSGRILLTIADLRAVELYNLFSSEDGHMSCVAARGS